MMFHAIAQRRVRAMFAQTLDSATLSIAARGWPWDLVVMAEWADRATPAEGTPANRGVHVVRLAWGRVLTIHSYLGAAAPAPALADAARNAAADEIAALDRAGRSSLPAIAAQATGARAIGASAIGSSWFGGAAIGAAATGALAVGALAIGRLAIGRLTLGRARIRRLEIDELVVRSAATGVNDD